MQFILTPNHQISKTQLLKMRNLTEKQLKQLYNVYGNFILDILYKIDVLEFEFNEEFDLFITHNYELFNDQCFIDLLDGCESTSDSYDNGTTYETQVSSK
jgi:hypothetical protein